MLTTTSTTRMASAASMRSLNTIWLICRDRVQRPTRTRRVSSGRPRAQALSRQRGTAGVSFSSLATWHRGWFGSDADPALGCLTIIAPILAVEGLVMEQAERTTAPAHPYIRSRSHRGHGGLRRRGEAHWCDQIS